jgi:CRISPR-associated endonuclease/helicase Cas3
MKLYEYQKRVARTLRAGKNVVLQAPTGSGKTFAALWPFLEAWDRAEASEFPSQSIYSAPMRVLTGQFEREAKKIVNEELLLAQVPEITVQTGERPEDPKFEGDLIFTTLDQTLSSVLGVPYSLSRGQSNLNVGAVLGSYLVFDEFHLFPHQATKATLQLLRVIGRIAPFILMTATFSKTMLEEIGNLLGAEVIVVPEEEVAQIETRWGERPRKQRRFRVVEHPITSDSIINADSHDLRSLVVCNTVDRATELYDDLIARGCRPVPFTDPRFDDYYQALRMARKPEDRKKNFQQILSQLREHLLYASGNEPWVMLLHSRFERPHRQVKEELLQSLWGPKGLENKDGPSLIVVATQVVEVGLDISSQTLHTDLAPAASVLQRAGRCARYPGEQGMVNVYQVPENKRGEPNYAPYSSKEEKEICARTWEALCERHDTVMQFEREQGVINSAHTFSDRHLLDEMRQDQGRIWTLISDALSHSDLSTRRELIRDNIESRTILVYVAPDGPTEDSPYRVEGFSMWQGTLLGKLDELMNLQKELGMPWALRYPVSRSHDDHGQTPVVYQWLDAGSKEDISASLLFAVHPRLVTYDAERGFRLAETGDGCYTSLARAQRSGRSDYGGYRLESYVDHITRMRKVFERGPLRRRLTWLARRLAEQDNDWYLPPGLLERAVYLVFVLHDLGKLDAQWQKWAVEYQVAIGEGDPNFLIAHTHWERDNPLHRAAQKNVGIRKPKTHAGEGADASARLLYEALHGKRNAGLYKAAFTAVARHHSPFLEGAQHYRLHPAAKDTLAKTFVAMGKPNWNEWATWLRDSPDKEPDILRRLISPYPDDPLFCWWLYFILVRNLRLCDGLSQEQE